MNVKNIDNHEYNEEYDDCLEQHPYALATAESERQMSLRQEMATQRGRPYNEITYQDGKRHFPLPDVLEKNPGLKAVINANATGMHVLTVARCEIVSSIVDEAHLGRPLWVIHCPDAEDFIIEGCCFFAGLSEQELDARREEESGNPILYWMRGRHDMIGVNAESVIESLSDAEAGEGDITIAFIGQDSFVIRSVGIPVGLVDWLNVTPSEGDCSKEHPIYHRDIKMMTVKHWSVDME